MKYIAVVFLLLSISAQGDDPVMLSDLGSLQWDKRVVVVNNVQGDESVLILFGKNKTEINDRDIVWFVIKGERLSTNYAGKVSKDLLNTIREKYKLEQGKVILIGKDGGVKSLSDDVDLEAIFSKIDAMPMRQSERQRNE